MSSHYIVAASASAFAASEPAQDLKALLQQACGMRPRRTSRLTDLSLLGACGCVQQRELSPQRTGIYLGSGHGNPLDVSDMLRQFLVENIEPMPLTFINVSSNMPGYYVAQRLGVSGRNMALAAGSASFDRVMTLALLDLDSGALDQALVGTVEECGYPLDTYRARLQLADDAPLAESSSWLLLSRTPGEAPLAELRWWHHFSEAEEAVDMLRTLPAATRYVCVGELPSPLAAQLKERQMVALGGEAPGYNMSIGAWQLVQALAQGGEESLLYLRAGARGELFAMWLSGRSG